MLVEVVQIQDMVEMHLLTLDLVEEVVVGHLLDQEKVVLVRLVLL